MNLQSIADIHDEISVLMPSGMPATLCVCDDGIIVDYGQGIKDTYSTDEFGKIVADGIQVFEKPSQMVIEDFNNCDHIEKQNKLDRIVKYNKDTKNRQIARGLLDRLNLGADDDKEIEKFVKKANKNEKLEIKRNKTMDIKEMNKVLESYIENETHDNILELAQQQMKPEEIDHHQSDLYLKKTPISDKLIANYRWKNSVTTFRDNIDNELWYEIPFAYGHKVRESYINEISDETVNKVADKRKHNFKKAERNFGNTIKKAWKNTENIKDSEDRYNKIMNQTDKTEKKYAQANQKLQNNKLLNKLRNKRKEQSKNESYIVREMIGNYSTVVGRFDLFDEAQDFLMDEWYKYAEENNIDLDNESEQQNFFSYYSLEETKNESKINENWKDYDYQYLSIKQALNDIEDEYTRNKYLQDFEGLIKRLEYSSKNENKINEGNYDSQGDAWYNFCKNVKNYAKEHGVDINEAIYQELDDMVYFSDVINVWTNMPGNLGSRVTEITDLMREDIQEGAFDEIEYIENLDESKINESLDGDIVTVVDIPLVTEQLYNKLVNVLYRNKRGRNRDYEQQQNVLNFLQEIEDRIPLESGISIDLEDYGFTTDEINAIKKIVRELKNKFTSKNESMSVKKYKVTLKSDKGKVNITTTASSEKQAIKQVCDIEHAPESAVISVKELNKSSKMESKINEKMSVKKAKELYKKHGMLFLDDKEGKQAYDVLHNAGYTMKKRDDVAHVIEFDRMREAFGDTMLTDINDLDFPQALQDTVETDEEGELLTLGKVADQIKDLKDELVDELKDIKDDLKDEINDIKKDMQDEISDELSDEELADIEDIEFEDVPMETEEIETEEIDEPETKEKEEKEDKEEKETDEDKEDKEDKIEESFKKYITKGKYEDLAQTKREVDKLTQQGKDAKEIKDTITLLADDEKEEDEAEKYAVSKLKESLLATSRTSKLNNL